MSIRAVFTLWDGTLGGAENLTLQLSREMLAHPVVAPEIWFLSSGGELADRARRAGVTVRELGWRTGGQAAWRGTRDDDGRPRVVLAYGYGMSLLSAVRSRARGVVVIEHGGGLLNPTSRQRRRVLVDAAVRRLMAPRVAAEVCVSEFMKSTQEQVPHAKRLLVIPNGVDTEEFFARAWPARDDALAGSGPLVLTCAGRLVDGKGFDLAVRVTAELLKRGHAVRLRVAGTGPRRDALIKLTSELRLDDYVDFVGRVTSMAAFWRAGHVALALSDGWVESFGMAAAEASSCALPVVATRAGGLSEIVKHEVTGMTVPPGSVEAAVLAVERYIHDPSRLSAHGLAGRSLCERRFAIGRVAEAYASLVESVACRSGES